MKTDKKIQTTFLIMFLLLAVLADAQTEIQYPKTEAGNHVDIYLDNKIVDPYRWLEDGNTPKVSEWVGEQNKLAFDYLQKLPARIAIKERMIELFDYHRINLPVSEGGRIFSRENDGLQDQWMVYVRDSNDAKPRLLLDPNTFTWDGSRSMSTFSPSPNGKLLAYGVRDSGSDWQTFRLRDVESGQDFSDSLSWIKFSGITWTKDNAGFFYSRYDEPEVDALTARNAGHQLYYHRIATPQSEDLLIMRSDDYPQATLGTQITDDGRYVLVHQYKTRLNQSFVLDLKESTDPHLTTPLVPLFAGFDASYSLMGNDGPTLYILTNSNAEMKHIVAVDVERSQKENWRTIIPESKNTIVHADIIGNRFVVEYFEDAKSSVRFFSITGEPMGTLNLPGIGSLFGRSGGFNGNREDSSFLYSFHSFLNPGGIYRYDFQTKESTVYQAAESVFNAEPYMTEQVFYTSKDGTRIPMFIVRRKDLVLDSSNPVMLHGYGGFGFSWPPEYDPIVSAWLEMGGVAAFANLRGGGEYGRTWHEGGMFENKQNVFDDFIAAGEYLIKESYTSTDKLAIMGTSMGGLLVGAVMVQRPDLFAVALPEAGLYDMLRYHLFVGGQFGLSEFGSSDTSEGFDYLLGYSPLHNVKNDICYPATLITAADHDDRVPPRHAYKFAATLQAAQGCDRPVLLRVDTDAGHGYGMPLSQVIAKYADMWAFAAEQLKLDVKH